MAAELVRIRITMRTFGCGAIRITLLHLVIPVTYVSK
jgi:hypothetical protein